LRDLRARVLAAPTHRNLVCVIAPSGAGKSTFLQSVFVRETPEPDLVILAPGFVDRGRLSISFLYEYLLRALRTPYREVQGLSPMERHEALLARLDALAAEEKRVALLLDDAHLFSEELLLSVKAWVEMAKGYRRLMGVILVGQEELGDRLALPRFRQIRGRADIIEWPEFTARHIRSYLDFKVQLAGGEFGRVFQDDVPAAIAKRLKGGHADQLATPMAVEACAALAMRWAWAAEEKHVTAAHVRDARAAAEDYEEAEEAAPARATAAA